MQQPSWTDMKINEQFQNCNQRLPDGKICEAHFDSPIGLIKHLRSVHGFPEIHKPLIAAVVELKGPNYEGRNGYRSFLKMAPYEKDKFCIIHVVEFTTWVRIWATEADPLADPEQIIPINITVPCPGFEENVQQEHLHQFTGKILPFGKYHFKENDPVEYFDVPKNFLQQFYEKRADGRFGLRILFAFGDFDVKEVFKDDGDEMVVLQIREEDESFSPEGSQDGYETVATESSGFGDDEDDDDEVIMRPFYEIYD